MRKLRIGRLVTLGGMARFLYQARVGWSIHGKGHIIHNIENLLLALRDLNFRVTLAASGDLRRFAEALRKYPQDAKLSLDDLRVLSRTMDRIDHTMRAEARTLNAYVLTETRFDAAKLVDSPEQFLSQETFPKLPRIARLDIKEAGKCIAFDVPTAGAFHLLRATEDTLRSYYRLYIKRGNIEKANWGYLVTQLRDKKRKPKPNETLINHLDHIRRNFRNPTDHPSMVYDIDGVQDLFSLVVDALNRMATELPPPMDWLDELEYVAPQPTAAISHLATSLQLTPTVEDSALDKESPTGDVGSQE